ncbi:MAG TPA: hypothetical protein P5026_07550 [Kiritimatiellia bacterium]|nr:hypothetical protein [Kiritimatiellia bacterium]HRU70959.1 hypothetical protein [Kiritimatiellia bacterium]
MCDVAIALAGVAAAGTLAGTGMSVYGAHQQGKFQKDMMNYQSALDRQRASLAEKNAEIQAGRLQQQRRLEVAAGMTEFAKNGMLIDGEANSAPNVWEQDMAAETAWRMEELRDQAMYEAWGHNVNASMLTAQGSMARRGATMEMWGAGLSGLGQVAGYAAKGYDSHKEWKAGQGGGSKISANYAGVSGTHGGGSTVMNA